MPIYEYQCSTCGHHFDELQRMSELPLTRCPACGKDTLKRLIGSGAGLIFKGSGFYLTDYKKKSETKASTPLDKSRKVKTPEFRAANSPEAEPKKHTKKEKK